MIGTQEALTHCDRHRALVGADVTARDPLAGSHLYDVIAEEADRAAA